MLGAGVVAAGDVEVHGLVEQGERGVERVGECDGVRLGVGGGEAAALAAGAGYGAGEDDAGFIGEAGGANGLLRRLRDVRWGCSG